MGRAYPGELSIKETAKTHRANLSPMPTWWPETEAELGAKRYESSCCKSLNLVVFCYAALLHQWLTNTEIPCMHRRSGRADIFSNDTVSSSDSIYFRIMDFLENPQMSR